LRRSYLAVRTPTETGIMDFLMLGLVAALFALTRLLLRLCEKR
jgi:hypothetical protein